MPAWKVQKEMENKAPRQMAETTVIEVILFINQEQLNLTLLTEGPQTSPPLPTGLLLHRHFWAAAAEWDGFPFFLLSSFCAWLQVPVALPKPALWFTEVVSSNTKRWACCWLVTLPLLTLQPSHAMGVKPSPRWWGISSGGKCHWYGWEVFIDHLLGWTLTQLLCRCVP